MSGETQYMGALVELAKNTIQETKLQKSKIKLLIQSN